MSNEFMYPHPDPDAHPWALEGGPSHIRVYPYSAHDWDHFSEGGDPLTDFVEPPIVTEEMNGRFDVQFRYKKDGNNADKLDYMKILICPVPIYWEEMFYIAEMEEDLDSILVTAKHITFLADRTPMDRFALKNATGQQVATAAMQAMQHNEPQIALTSTWREMGPRADIRVEKNTTVQDFMHNVWIPMYGGMLWRVKRQVGLRERRGGDTQVELAKYKNIRELMSAGDIDKVVTRAHVRAEIQRDWLLPPKIGEPPEEDASLLDQNAKGILHVAVHDMNIGSSEYIDGVMRFGVYNANGHKIDSFSTHSTETAQRQADQRWKWNEDLRKKRERLAEGGDKKWWTEQRPKLVDAIAELEEKLALLDEGRVGRWLTNKAIPGTYTLVLESAPEGYIADYWPKRNITVNTTDNTTVKWYLWPEDTDGVTAEPYLEKVLDSPLIDQYPMVLDGFYTVRDPSIITQSALDAYAEQIYSQMMTDHLQEDITITPDDLVTLETFNIGSTALVYFEEEDTTIRVPCVAYAFDALKQEIISYTFGKKKRLLGGVLNEKFRQFANEMRMEGIQRQESQARAASTQVLSLAHAVNGQLGDLSEEMDFQVRSLRADVVDTNILLAAHAEIDEALIEKATITELDAERARIHTLETHSVTTDYLYANYANVSELQAQYATITSLNAANARIDTLTAGTVTTEYLEAHYATITALQAEQARIDDLVATRITTDFLDAHYAKIVDLDAKYATIELLNAVDAKFGNLSATYATVIDLNAAKGQISDLSATQAEIQTLVAGKLDATDVTAQYLQAKLATLDTAWITNAMIDTVSADRLRVDEANIKQSAILDAFIKDLDAAVITTGTLDAGRIATHSITADKLEAGIEGKLGIVAREEIQLEISGAVNNLKIGPGENLLPDVAPEIPGAMQEGLEILSFEVDLSAGPQILAFEASASKAGPVLVYSKNGPDIGQWYLDADVATRKYLMRVNPTEAGTATVYLYGVYGSGMTLTASAPRVSPAAETEISEWDISSIMDGSDRAISFDLFVSQPGTVLVYSKGDYDIGNRYIDADAPARYGFGVTPQKVANTGSTKLYIYSIYGSGVYADVRNLKIEAGSVVTGMDFGKYVPKTGVKTAINLSPEGIRIQGEHLRIDALTTIDEAVIQTAHLSDALITTAKIADLAVDSAKIEMEAVDTSKIKDLSVTTAKIAEAAIGTTQIADASITDAKIVEMTANKLTAGRIDAGEIEVVNLRAANITVGQINGMQIEPGAIIEDHILDGSVSVEKLNEPLKDTLTNLRADLTTAEGEITDALADIDTAKSDISTMKQRFVTNEEGILTAQTTADGKNRIFYSETAPTDAKENDLWFDTVNANRPSKYIGGVWTPFQLGNLAVGALDAATITSGYLAAARIESLSITADKIAADAITAVKIAGESITADKIAANAVVAEKIAADAVVAEKIASDAVVARHIQADAVNADKIAANAIATKHLQTDAVTTDKIVADAITAAKIAAKTITANEIQTGTITAESGIIADAAIVSAKIADAAITNAKIDRVSASRLVVETADIKDAAITNAKIKDLAVTDAKIYDLRAEKIVADWIESGHIKTGSLTTNIIAAEEWANLDLSSNTSIQLAVKVPVNRIDGGQTKTGLEYVGYADLAPVATPGAYTLSFDLDVSQPGEVLVYSTGKYSIGQYYIDATPGKKRYHVILDVADGDGAKPDSILSFYGIYGSGMSLTVERVMFSEGASESAEYHANPDGFVRKDGVLSAINLSGETVTIDGRWLHIDAETTIDTASIDAAAIRNLTVDAAQIQSVDASKITVGELDGARIKANTITANHLAADVGQTLDLTSNRSIRATVESSVVEALDATVPKNLIRNGGFESGLPDGQWRTNGATVGRDGIRGWNYISLGTGLDSYARTNLMQFAPDTDYFLRFQVYSRAVGDKIALKFKNADGNVMYESSYTTAWESTAWGAVNWPLTPNEAMLAEPVYLEVSNAQAVSGTTRLTRFQMEVGTEYTDYERNAPGVVAMINMDRSGVQIAGEKVTITGETHIANGVIGTAHISSAAITNAKIADATITNAKISDLSADKIKTGVLRAKTGNSMIDLDNGIFSFDNARFVSHVGAESGLEIDDGSVYATDGLNHIKLANGELRLYPTDGEWDATKNTIITHRTGLAMSHHRNYLQRPSGMDGTWASGDWMPNSSHRERKSNTFYSIMEFGTQNIAPGGVVTVSALYSGYDIRAVSSIQITSHNDGIVYSLHSTPFYISNYGEISQIRFHARNITATTVNTALRASVAVTELWGA